MVNPLSIALNAGTTSPFFRPTLSAQGLFFLSILVELFCGGVYATPAPATAPKTEPHVRIALNWKPEPEFGGFYLALEEGLFKNKTVELIQGGTGTPTPQLAASGQVEFAIVGADELLMNLERGGDLVALFSVYDTSPMALISHESRGFKNLEELLSSNSTLLWQEGAAFALYLKRQFPKFKVREAPYKGGVSFLIQDSKYIQQGFITSEPFLAAKAGVKVKSFLVAESGFNPYVALLATRRKYLEANRKLVESLVSEIRAGWLAYLKDPKPTNIRMNKLNPSMELEIFNKGASAQTDLILPKSKSASNLGTMELSRWIAIQQQLLSSGILKKAIDPKTAFVEL